MSLTGRILTFDLYFEIHLEVSLESIASFEKNAWHSRDLNGLWWAATVRVFGVP